MHYTYFPRYSADQALTFLDAVWRSVLQIAALVADTR